VGVGEEPRGPATLIINSLPRVEAVQLVEYVHMVDVNIQYAAVHGGDVVVACDSHLVEPSPGVETSHQIELRLGDAYDLSCYMLRENNLPSRKVISIRAVEKRECANDAVIFLDERNAQHLAADALRFAMTDPIDDQWLVLALNPGHQMTLGLLPCFAKFHGGLYIVLMEDRQAFYPV
jgi:hypothetical protein